MPDVRSAVCNVVFSREATRLGAASDLSLDGRANLSG